MRIRFNRDAFVGGELHPAGRVVDVPDELGHAHVRARSAAIALELPVEHATAAAPETAENRKQRKA